MTSRGSRRCDKIRALLTWRRTPPCEARKGLTKHYQDTPAVGEVSIELRPLQHHWRAGESLTIMPDIVALSDGYWAGPLSESPTIHRDLGKQGRAPIVAGEETFRFELPSDTQLCNADGGYTSTNLPAPVLSLSITITKLTTPSSRRLRTQKVTTSSTITPARTRSTPRPVRRNSITGR